MKKKHLLLINPWIYDFAAYDFWIKPIGLLSVGNYLEKHGYHTTLIDCLDRYHPLLKTPQSRKYGTGHFVRTKVEKPDILSHVPRYYCRYGLPLDIFLEALEFVQHPDAILVTSGMTYWYQGVFFVIELLKKKFPNVPVLLGGIYATLCSDHAVKNSGADFVVKGKGEVEALKIMNSITGEEDIFDDSESVLFEPVFHYYNKLASIPLLTSLGCPFHCSFCASNLLSGKFKQFNHDGIIENIFYFNHKKHVENFAFFDDALLVNSEKHISVILDAVINNKLNINFHTPNGLHAGEITDKLATQMFQANFKTIRLSYESISKSRQKEMGFKVTDDKLITAINNLARAGFQRKNIDVYVIMGLPEQTVDEVIESMLFVISLGAKVRLTSFSPIPGTKDWQRSVELYNMDQHIDPLLTNNSIYPLNREDFTYSVFQELRNLAKVLNYGLDQEINFFDQSNIAHAVSKQFKKQ